jgi:hypothetical protein
VGEKRPEKGVKRTATSEYVCKSAHLKPSDTGAELVRGFVIEYLAWT